MSNNRVDICASRIDAAVEIHILEPRYSVAVHLSRANDLDMHPGTGHELQGSLDLSFPSDRDATPRRDHRVIAEQVEGLTLVSGIHEKNDLVEHSHWIFSLSLLGRTDTYAAAKQDRDNHSAPKRFSEREQSAAEFVSSQPWATFRSGRQIGHELRAPGQRPDAKLTGQADRLRFVEEGLTIRDARETELNAVGALLLDAYAQYMPAPGAAIPAEARVAWEEYRKNIADVWSRAPLSSTIIAERDGKLLGSVNYYAPGQSDSVDNAWPDGWASVRLLGVSPAARGLGIGRALMDECLCRARADGATTLGLHTTMLMNVARAMYVRLGFTRVPEHDFHPVPDFTIEAYALKL